MSQGGSNDMQNVHLKESDQILVFLATNDHSTGHGVVEILWFFIFSESVSQGGSYNM